MKTINNYIQEKLKLNKTVIDNYGKNQYTLFPKTREELIEMIKQEMEKNGKNCSLNHIDVSNITDMTELFKRSNFNGDISNWDVSKVEDMKGMFMYSLFDSDISSWDVSNVKDMRYMFTWSDFNKDVSNWEINPDCNIGYMFRFCRIEDKYRPKINGITIK